MSLHFTADELAERRRRTVDAMTGRGLDGLLLFRQESMYYLTGYDTFCFCFFQCLYLDADGAMTLLTRSPDLRQARITSMIEDIRIWVDLPDADPARTDLRPILEEHGCRGTRLGVEWESHGLTARNGRRLAAALDGFCTLADASDLVNWLRAVKSPREIDYVRRAGRLADDALAEAVRRARPGAFGGEILAAMQAAVLRGDGDYPGNEFVIGSGPDAMVGRYKAGRRTLGDDDQLTIEFAGVFRHYHVCLMNTIKVGAPNRKHKAMFQLGLECMAAAEHAIRPGRPIGAAYDAYWRTLAKGGYDRVPANACGYGLGATFSPSWMDWPMLYHGNPAPVEAGMVFFLHTGVRDFDDGLVAAPGETVLVTEGGCERLTETPLAYVHNR